MVHECKIEIKKKRRINEASKRNKKPIKSLKQFIKIENHLNSALI